MSQPWARPTLVEWSTRSMSRTDLPRPFFRRPPFTVRRTPSLERLEDRTLLSITAEEQSFIYLLNRARHDPAAYQQEAKLNADLSAVAPQPPLAVNDKLLA